MHHLSIVELGKAIRSGELSPLQITEHFLNRIDKLDGHLHAFQRLTHDRALSEAKVAEQELQVGEDRGPLHGIPYVAKDLYDVCGEPTTAGCRFLEHNIASMTVRSCDG